VTGAARFPARIPRWPASTVAHHHCLQEADGRRAYVTSRLAFDPPRAPASNFVGH
jgi:hypothetical protein